MKYSKIAFIFPGQGAQVVGMGKDFASTYASAKIIYEEADDILKRKVSDVIWNGPDSLLLETRNSQIGIFITSMAILNVINHLFPSLKPTFCAGLSLGEYSALTASGKITFHDALKLVDKRGKYMNDACLSTQGSMAVIMGLNSDLVEDIVKKINLPNDLFVANLNCPGQVVISGTAKGIEAATKIAKEQGAKRVLPLAVQGAFHSGLMQQAEDRLKPKLAEVPLQKSPIQLLMNYSGAIVHELEAIRHQLIKQVTSPVRWEEEVRLMNQEGADLLLEIGCGKTLTGMNRKIGVKGKVFSLERLDEIAELEELL